MSADITINRGTTKPDVAWRLGNNERPFDGTGSVFVLAIESGNNRIIKRTDDPASGLTFDNETKVLRWARTLEDSRKIRPGRVGRYEIERRIDGQQSLIVEGIVIGKETISDD